MNLRDIKQAYFLGIGGIGMSAIARYFNHLGIRVRGYDKTETPLTQELSAEGIENHYEDLGDRIASFGLTPADTLVVLTPAIPKDHAEWAWLVRSGFQILKRSQVLGLISDAYRTIGVAGTHGKTTTSTLIAHLLKHSSADCAAFLGGISANYQTNLLLNGNGKAPGEQWMVVEADEFDRSFLTLHPEIGIITSTDADHLDIYGEHDALKQSFRDYAAQVREVLFVKKELDWTEHGETTHKRLTYSVKNTADACASNIRIEEDRYHFDFISGSLCYRNLELGIPGMHNVENAVAATAVAIQCGLSETEIRNGLASFKGVKRRFEYLIKRKDRIYIDDYAHHPEELRAFLSSIKAMYPGRTLTAIFQPHLYTRTRDFADGFAESLALADDLILLDIYPARELPIPGVTSSMILEKMQHGSKMLCAKQDLLSVVATKNPGILVTVGAGDIDQFVGPLTRLLNQTDGIQ